MEIGAISRMDLSALVTAPTISHAWVLSSRQVIGAVQYLNQAQWFGPDRQLTYSHDRKTGRFVMKILELSTGDVLDQIPTEAVLRLVTDLQAQLESKDGKSTTRA